MLSVSGTHTHKPNFKQMITSPISKALQIIPIYPPVQSYFKLNVFWLPQVVDLKEFKVVISFIMEFNSFLLFLGTILVLGYLFVKKKFSYWADRGVPSVPPVFPFGNLAGVAFSVTLGQRMKELYFTLKKTKSVIGGSYSFTNPSCLVLDLDLLRNIFVKDFQYFINRGMYVNEKGDPLTAHLFSIAGEKWKNMRTKLSPTFTSGKMKMMHATFLNVAKQFKDHLMPMAEKGSEVEIKELLSQFTTDVIGNVAFGLEMNSMKDEDSDFRRFGKKVFMPTPFNFFRRILVLAFPKLALRLNVTFIDRDVSSFFLTTIRETIDYREKNHVERNDFLQLLMQIKNTGKLDGETVDLGTITFEELAAQTFVFFLAGFETSSSTMTFACYEFALNQELQDKAREEVRQVLERHNGVLNYEAALEMTFLDQVIQGEFLEQRFKIFPNIFIFLLPETLRKYPIVAVLRRQCDKDYQIPNTDLVIEKGVIVAIPVLGIHHDPEIYPDPERFDPDRFTKEAIAARHPYAYLPFGKGPRDCIGMRFGMMQTRVGLATLLNSYRLHPSENTPIPITYAPSSPVLSPSTGMFLRIEKV